MAIDAITIRALCYEFKTRLCGLKIDKIYQPEADELIIGFSGPGKSERLLLSANANIPRANITKEARENPSTPPMFCMLLRKHILSGKLKDVVMPDFERILEFKIETKDDFGDTVLKSLIVEIMGRHSNIILTDKNRKILGSIKHIDFSVSSVRQVLPGLMYEYPPAQDKINPLSCSFEDFVNVFKKIKDGERLESFITSSFCGISSLIAREIAYTSNASGLFGAEIDYDKILDISSCINRIFSKISENDFEPVAIENTENGKLIDFAPITISQYGSLGKKTVYDSISTCLENFYKNRALFERMQARSTGLTKLVSSNISRCSKKYEIQLTELSDAEKKEKYQRFGELVCANIYKIEKGAEFVMATDYSSEGLDEIKIPLDKNLSPSANAQKYFKKYNKLKNREIFVSREIEKTKAELNYLETVEEELKRATTLSCLAEIRDELKKEGYIKGNDGKNKSPKKKKNSPYEPELLSYVTDDGFKIFVGKNNKQNDYLTTKKARNSDLWFHTKDIPGSHVVLMHEHDREFSQEAILTAARLAAFNSKAKNSIGVPVDYTLIKNVKKPSGAHSGFVIFTNNKTVFVTPQDAK